LNQNNLRIFIFDEFILVQNNLGQTKEFPRCNIAYIEAFVLEMIRTGNLDELLH